MAASITVNSPDGHYQIEILPGVLRNRQRLNDLIGAKGRIAVVTNTTLAPIYGQRLVDSLMDAVLIVTPDGEQYKTLETVAQLYADFVAAGLDRSATIVALGGGVVGDTAGFAAATYMRGVRLIQMPTSLLSMVDSSVGGKVGVDLPQGKNLVGAFKQPDRVLIDTQVLETLPVKEWRCGMGEVVKHGFLADAVLLEQAVQGGQQAAELVRRAVQVKVDVVEQDPYEQNIRAHLNLGHTFAHAIEQVTAYEWAHGEAVGAGLMAAVHLSHRLALCDAALVDQVEQVLTAVGLPTRLDGLNPEALYAAMATDKKWRGGRSRFVLLCGVGQPTIVEDVPKAHVIDVLEKMR